MKTVKLLLIFCLSAISTGSFAKVLNLKSPDGKISVNVDITDVITYSVSQGETVVVAPSPLSLSLNNGVTLGENPKIRKILEKSINSKIFTRLYKKSELEDSYNELTILFAGDYGLVFRAYNQGVAYRFTSTIKESFNVINEQVTLNLGKDREVLVPYVKKFDPENPEKQFFHSFENTYTKTSISAVVKNRLIFLPLLVELDNGKKLCFTESDLENYPGLYLTNNKGDFSFEGKFAQYPKTTLHGGHNMLQQLVTERENYIAKISGPRDFPWRVFAISESDKELLNNDLVYLLASPSRIADVSWIKPGKVAWDWWNDWNIYGVDFKAGINNETYKYYIDFASEHGIEYVILDEGWAVNKKADLFEVVPEINLPELIAYGKSKNVGIILWAGYWAMERDMERVCKTYSEMGVKGFKVDFMDRDDQAIVDFYYRCASMAAKYKLMVDFHGAYKPTGLNRVYPNVINSEGVFGLEQLKWSSPDTDMVQYDVTMPFIRMLAGPVDYTQGAMRNATKNNYRPVNTEPMSQGTRCHQLAEYVVFESPLNMLCDSPSNYKNESLCTKFIAEIPTVWEKTIPLDSKVGEYITIARKSADSWYIGALTNWTERDLKIDLSFLENDDYIIDIFRDGANSDRVARDFKHDTMPLPADRKLSVKLMPGGGFAAKIFKKPAK